MPGIAGIICRRPLDNAERLVKTMVATMRHEPFHTSGVFSEPPLGIHAGWVAHEKSFTDGQPFQNETREVTLLLSGECFIPVTTRDRLRRAGHVFQRDAECLVHLYEEEGDAFLAGLNGLFSGLLIDAKRRRALLFNDRYGMERLYWHERDGVVYFASEAKALLRVLPDLRAFNPEGVADFLAVNCPLATRTLFRGIERLPGGTCWRFEDGNAGRDQYFTPATWEALPKLSEAAWEQKLQETVQRIAPRYFQYDSRLGVALTGGLDTRMILACRPAGMTNQICYTFTAPTGLTLDDRVAVRVAAALKLEHHLLRLDPGFFRAFQSHADKTVFVTDGNFGVYGSHEIYFNRMARSLATIRLTGNYGSEVLRAISTFKPTGLPAGLFHPDFAPQISAGVARYHAERQHPETFAAFKEVPWSLFGNMAAGRSQLSFRTPYLDNELVALAYQCPAGIKKSSLPTMRLVKAFSPELDRIPTDRGFVSDRRGPSILARRVFAEATFKLDYHSDAGLPRKLGVLDPIYKPIIKGLGIAGLHKFLKYGTWFRQDLQTYVREGLERAARLEFFDAKWLAGMADRHVSGRKNHTAEIHYVLTLEAVERTLLRDLPRN
jgi:asparagine synthase (glutamine-hydrolysing)